MTKIKICGITTLQDALTAAQAGADMLGFNFYPKSPRYIAPEACRAITAALRPQHPHLTLVGVFVNAPVEAIRTTLSACQLHLAQLHGDESPSMLAALNGYAFKAIRLSAPPGNLPPDHPLPASDPLDLYPSIVPFLQSAPASASHPALLLDAAVPGLYGGSGVITDWAQAAQLARRIPLLLAGGLTPENVAEAIRQVHPWGVDVASGVESRPGIKDPDKIKKFIDSVKQQDIYP